jgi:AAA domain-containing protein
VNARGPHAGSQASKPARGPKPEPTTRPYHAGSAETQATTDTRSPRDLEPRGPERPPHVWASSVPFSSRPLREFDDLQAESLPPAKYLVAGLLFVRSLAVLYSNPGVGKTIIAFAWAFAVALGRSWGSHAVMKGPVVYVFAENSGGLPARVRAYKKAHKFAGRAGIYFVTEPLNMLSADSVRAFISQFKSRKPVLVVLDTLARCFVGGEEVWTSDMCLFVHNADVIREELNATILILHHQVKDGTTERGSGALRGAADTMIRAARRSSTPEIVLHCNKQKDAPLPKPITVRVSTEKLDDEQSSCVAFPVGGGAEEPLRVGEKEQVALDALGALGRARHSKWLKASGLKDRTFDRVLSDLKSKDLVVFDEESACYRVSPTAMAPPDRCHDGGTAAAPAPLSMRGRAAAVEVAVGTEQSKFSMRPERGEDEDEDEG